jgi:type 2 lantibiotic biosynthesis protein LanM
VRITLAAFGHRMAQEPVDGLGPGSAANAILGPFLVIADELFNDLLGLAQRDMSPEACTSFRQCLADRLLKLIRRTLTLEWEVYCKVRRSQAEGAPPQDDELGGAFASSLRKGGTLAILNRYAVLVRLGAITINRWLATTRDFLARLTRDRPAIAERFQRPTGRVVAISHNWSDLHNGHECVSRVVFDSGLVVFYKPRPGGCEAALGRVVDWINRNRPSAELKSVEVLDRGAYCWVEEITHAPCATRHDGREYYRRAGMLLALMYVLHGRDLHYENLIAKAATPYVIDIETILEPEFVSDTTTPPFDGDAPQAPTVFDVGMLPSLFTNPAGVAIDISALRGIANEMKNGDAHTRAPLHRPFAFGTVLDPLQHADDLIAGFRDTYNLITLNRSGPSGFDSELAVFRRTVVRVIIRHTESYAALLDLSLSPKHLRNGVDRSIELHVIGKPLNDGEVLAKQWQAFRSELLALESLDVPYFSASADDTHLFDASGPVLEGCLAAPPLERVITGLDRLSADDCEKQIGLIRCSLNLPGVRLQSTTAANLRGIPNFEKAAWAVSIGEMLLRDAIRRPDGSFVWSARREDFRYCAPGLIDNGLYGGTLGLAFFFASLYRHTGREDFRDAAGRAVAPSLAGIRNGDQRPTARTTERFGLAAGLGSKCYAFARLAEFLGDRSYLSHALSAVHSVDSTEADGEVALDLMDGIAGGIVGLVVLHEAASDAGVLNLASRLASRLLDTRQPGLNETRVWRSDALQSQVGFSHGASGIAYALGRLHAHRPAVELLECLRAALEYERAAFDSRRGNAAIFTSPERRGLEESWCSGASGVALARLVLGAILPDERVRDDLETALQATHSAPRSKAFHLCCGNFGRLAVAFEAALRRPRPDLLAHVENSLEPTLYQAFADAGTQFFPNFRRGSYIPGLFQGLAGVGYQLLRFANPAIYPGLLTFD